MLMMEQAQNTGGRKLSAICKLMSRPSIPSFAGSVRAGGICGEWPWLWRRLSFPSGDFDFDFDFDSEFGVCQRSQSAPHCSRNQLGLPSSPDGGGGITDEGEKHVEPADAQYEIRALPANAWSRR